MPIDFGKLTDKIVKRVLDNLQDSNPEVQNAGEQVGESFVDGIEQGLEDAASRITASSFKITKAFRDLSKKITSQSISLDGLSIDFSDIDINEADFQKKINEVFEKFKIDNAIEFDSAATEKQFKNMLTLHTKYALKLSKLQDQRPKLTSQASIKANAQAQLAIVDGLKEIQKILDQTSGMSIELPHVYFGDLKELRTSISLIEQMERGEEKVGKQRDTNAEKIRKENKELKERNRILEEKVGPIEDGELPPARKPRGRKPKVETPVVTGTGDSALQQLKRDADAAAKAFHEAEQKLYDIYEAEKKLDEQIKNAGLVDYTEKYMAAAEAREDVLDSLRGGITKKSDHVAKERQVRDVINNLKDSGALSDEDLASIQRSALEYNLTVGGKYAKTTKEQMDQMFARIFEKIDKGTLKQLSEYRNLGMKQEAEQDVNGLIRQRRQLTKEHEAATKAYNDAADASSEAHKKLYAAEEGVAPEVWAEQNKALEDQNAKLAERNRLINEYLEANKRVKAIEAKGYASPSDMSEEEFKVWSSAQETMHGIGMRTDADDIMQGVRDKIEKEFIEFGDQFEKLKNELGDPNQWLGQYTILLDQIRQGALTSTEAVAKLREEMAAKAAEEAFNAELEAAVAAEVEEELKAEQEQLDLAKEELKVEKEITKEKEKQYGYHAGKFRDDGFKAENLWQSTPGRSTGFYGTGTYMTDKDHLKEITTGQYGQRPLNVIDPDMYNLFDATNDKTAGQLHQFLKQITNKAFGGKGENIKSLYAEFKKLFPKEQIITYEDFKALVGELQQYVKDYGDKYPHNKTMDSVSTKFMKNFGYEGVDTRGTKHADTTYGTVVYDLKEESIVLKEITDEMQKQEIIAGNIASAIEKQFKSKSGGYHAMSRDDATGYIDEHYDHDVWDKWYSKSLDPFRTQIAQTLENDIEMRNAALNQMWDEYKHLTGEDIGFEEFLNKKIPLYRGEQLDSKSESEKALSFSLTPDTAEEFGERVLEIWLRPIDTLGMANPTYVHQPEAEVMVSKEFVPEYDKWRKSLITQPPKKISSEEKYTYDTDSGQISMLPVIEEEIKAKDKLSETNEKVAKSQKKIKEAAQGTQMTIDDIIPTDVEAKASQWMDLTSDDELVSDIKEAKALDKVGKAADKAANSKKKFAKANKEVADSVTPSVNGLENEKEAIEDVGEAAEKTTWQMTRPGVKSNSLSHTSDELENFNLPLDYMGERGQDAVQIFAKLKSEIEEMTGKPVIIDFVSDVNDEGQLEAVGATLKYVNEEAGITVKQFYDIKRNEDGVLVATQSQEKATLAAAKAAKVFNAEMQRKLALEQIKTLETQMDDLKLDLTEVKSAANAINNKASLENFNLALRAAKEQAKQLKAGLKGQNTLDTIASMERALLTLPSRLEEIQRRLNALGDIEGVDAIDDVLRSINNEYQRFLNSDDSEEKVKLFRDLTSSMVWANAEIRNLGGKNAENQRQTSASKKADDAQKKAERESYAAWWKSTIDAQDEADKYEKMLLEREQKEKAKDERVIAARKKQEEAYNSWWQKALFDKERAPNLKYGKTTANSARRKLDATEGAVDALGVTNPEVLAKLDAYKEKVAEVERLRERFASDHNAAEDAGLVKQFQKAAYEAENVRRGIKAVIDEEQKMAQLSAEQGFDPVELSAEQISNLENEMIAHAKATAQGRMEIKGWNDDHTKMYYTVTNSKGVVEEMTMALGQGRNMMYQYRTATKETGTLMQQIFKGIKVKAKELLSFVIGGGSVYKVIELLRQGIQYVREIDLALTELKKVTDETEESYDRFLETAAKTADKVGSTIQKVVSSTADWARLGHSMEDAAKFAESTQILMNVSEFTDVSQATDALISAVQAFGYTADTSMEVVDLLNIIGKQNCRCA